MQSLSPPLVATNPPFRAFHHRPAPTRFLVQCASRPDPSLSNDTHVLSFSVCRSRVDWQSACAILASKVVSHQQDTAPKHGSLLRVAYQGVPGAYSEAAAGKAFPECEAIPCDQFEVAFQAVELWIADRAVLPVENSLGGSIHRNYDLLLRHRLHIVGEVHHRDESRGNNVTRFVMLARDPIVPRTDRAFKTSVVFTHEKGTSRGVLFKVLSAFAFRNIGLTKIESRPHCSRDVDGMMRKHFEYMFYVDFEASLAEERAHNALAEVQEFTSFMRVLGSYPMDMTPSPSTTNTKD